jgi:hypothetical protein
MARATCHWKHPQLLSWSRGLLLSGVHLAALSGWQERPGLMLAHTQRQSYPMLTIADIACMEPNCVVSGAKLERYRKGVYIIKADARPV